MFQKRTVFVFTESWSRDQLMQKALLIAHFTVTVGNEAGVDLVLIQPFLLYYAKLVVVMLTSIF